MCLYVRDRKPLIAKRDIVVLKYLRQEGKIHKKYKSPCQGMLVTLGKLMIAQPNTPNIIYANKDIFNRDIYSIGGGVIHAKLNESNYYGNYCAKAIIPKGTEYWIDPFGTEIAARQMLITKEEGSNESVDTQLFKEILESAPEKNGIRVGDYQMIDDSFVHPTKRIAKTKVRGIVCGFYEDESPIICALETFAGIWGSSDSKIGEHTSVKKAMKLFNGREVTAQYKRQINDNDKWRYDAYDAFKICVNYRKEKNENWYFGSLGEIMTMLNNAMYLNAAHNITNLGFIININDLYWSCSEIDFCYSFGCCLNKFNIICGFYHKAHIYKIVPFYHMI